MSRAHENGVESAAFVENSEPKHRRMNQPPHCSDASEVSAPPSRRPTVAGRSSDDPRDGSAHLRCGRLNLGRR